METFWGIRPDGYRPANWGARAIVDKLVDRKTGKATFRLGLLHDRKSQAGQMLALDKLIKALDNRGIKELNKQMNKLGLGYARDGEEMTLGFPWRGTRYQVKAVFRGGYVYLGAWPVGESYGGSAPVGVYAYQSK